MQRIYESEIAEALFEAINTDSWETAQEAISSLRIDLQGYDINLDKPNASITISNGKQEFKISIQQTYQGI